MTVSEEAGGVRCENGGECLDGLGETFTCLCQPGWTGPHCEVRLELYHWSRSVQILSSHWWKSYYAGATVYTITIHPKASESAQCPHYVPFGLLLWHDKVIMHGKTIEGFQPPHPQLREN